MLDLAPKVIIQIFQAVRGEWICGPWNGNNKQEDQDQLGLKTTASLCRTSKLFNDLATPVLYQYLDLGGQKAQHAALLHTLEASPTLRRYLTKVCLDVSTNDEFFSEKDLETLLGSSPHLKEIMISVVNAAVEPTFRPSESMIALKEETLKPLSNSLHLHSLCLLGDAAPKIPDLPALKELYIAGCQVLPVLTSSSHPALKELQIQFGGTLFDQQPYDDLRSLIPNLSVLSLSLEMSPVFATEVLAEGTHLQDFKFLMNLSSMDFFEIDLKPVTPKAAIFGEMKSLNVFLRYFHTSPPSEQAVDGIKKLVFGLRRPKNVSIMMMWLRAESQTVCDEFAEYAREVWKAEGSTVSVQVMK